jgi:CxxC-x17-CxxC domain-containing protein
MGYLDKSFFGTNYGPPPPFDSTKPNFYKILGPSSKSKNCVALHSSRNKRKGNGTAFGYDRPKIRMFSAVCSQCGENVEVPFEPTNGKLVFCNDCYNKIKRPKNRQYA